MLLLLGVFALPIEGFWAVIMDQTLLVWFLFAHVLILIDAVLVGFLAHRAMDVMQHVQNRP